MKLRFMLYPALLCIAGGILPAQTIHQRETFHELSNPQVSDTLPGTKYMREHVVDGKLRLTLQEAVVLTLANNSNVRIQELNIDTAKYALLGAHQPFDPLAQASFSAQRSISQTFTQLSGVPTLGTPLSTLNQATQVGYSQTLETGTNFQINFNTSKLSSNSTFNFYNPSISSFLSFQFTQPLLRNRWLFANRAPLVIARRNLQGSRAMFGVQVSNTIQLVVTQYWNVVRARGNLEVARTSLDAAEATYKHDKRALELGALPPLDIYRSESQVAGRRVQVIQSEYALKQTEDAFRQILGVDLDPFVRALDLDLTEPAEPAAELQNIDVATALQEALGKRLELEVARQALANDDTSVRLAHNDLLPDLRLSGNYSGNGLGGNQYDIHVVPSQLIATGGFADSLSQLFGFGYPSYGVSLTLNLPIKNRSAQAALGNALVSRRRDLYTERQIREQITYDVSNAVHQLEQAKIGMAASKEAVDLARKTVGAEQRKYDLGQGQIFLVLEAQTELAAAEQGRLQAEIGYQLAVAALDYATGSSLQPYGVQIVELTQ